MLSVTTRCCCEIRREAATGGSHARSFDILASLPADTFWRSTWMDVSPDHTRKRCASLHVHMHAGLILLQLFAERGQTGLVFRPAAACLLSEAVSKPSGLFRKRNPNRNFFFFLSRLAAKPSREGKMVVLRCSLTEAAVQTDTWHHSHFSKTLAAEITTGFLHFKSNFFLCPPPIPLITPSPPPTPSFSDSLIFLCARLNCDPSDSRLC